MWNIYSVGDSSFLASVLRASALFFSSSIPNTLAGIGLIIGVLYQGFRGSMSGDGISFGRILMTALLYLTMMVPKTSVNIEDCYTGQSVNVSGVPLGPAVSASVISTMGYGVSKYVRTAFSGTDGSDNGFASAIVIMNDLRRKTSEISVLSTVNGAGGGNFEKSWTNYFRECTHTGIDLGTFSEDYIFSAEDIVRESGFSSSTYGTLINTDGHDELLTCSEAHGKLVSYTKGVFSEALFSAFEDSFVRENAGFRDGRSYRETVNSAVSSLGLINTGMEDYVLSSVLLPVYVRATKSKYLDEHALGSALTLNQTVNSISTASSLKQSLFFTMLRPLMTFFESLLFMLTPFMPLILMGTDNGLKLVARYLGVTVWVELWQPLLILVNFYLTYAASGSFSEMQIPPQSFNGIISISHRLESYIALGGYLSASVPALAMLVLYGSVSAVNSIAGTGGSFTGTSSDKTPYPTLEQKQAVVSHGSLFSGAPLTGISKTGAVSMMPSVSLKEGFREALSNAESEARSAEESFGRMLRESSSVSSSQGITHNSLESMGKRLSSGSSESYSMVNGLARSISASTGLSSTDESSLRGAIGMILSGETGQRKEKGITEEEMIDDETWEVVDRLGARDRKDLDLDLNNEKVGLSTIAEAAGANSSRSSVSKLQSELSKLAADESLQAQFSRTLARDISTGRVSSDTYTDSVGRSGELSRSASRAASRREEVNRLKSAESSLSGGYTFDGISASRAVLQSPKAYNRLTEEMRNNYALTSRANQLRPLMESVLPDSEQAKIAGGLRALMEKNPLKALEIIRDAYDVRGKDSSGMSVRDLSGSDNGIFHGGAEINGTRDFSRLSDTERLKSNESDDISSETGYYSDFLKNRSRVHEAYEGAAPKDVSADR